MSLKDFWISVRTGARFIAPTATADSPRLDSTKIEQILRKAAIWLTPKSVDGFDAADFDFLSTDERSRLTRAVQRFRDIAARVRASEPATVDQIQQALPEFLHIVEVLRPDKYADLDALVIGKKVERRLADKFPHSVAELRFETGMDSSGAPALWIWVVLRDEAAKGDIFLQNTRAIRELLESTVADLGVQRWPYVRFRTESELEPAPKKIKT